MASSCLASEVDAEGVSTGVEVPARAPMKVGGASEPLAATTFCSLLDQSAGCNPLALAALVEAPARRKTYTDEFFVASLGVLNRDDETTRFAQIAHDETARKEHLAFVFERETTTTRERMMSLRVRRAHNKLLTPVTYLHAELHRLRDAGVPHIPPANVLNKVKPALVEALIATRKTPEGKGMLPSLAGFSSPLVLGAAVAA
mmetsp:Transcript_17893/g.45799  ORF Transcript_17893/g.45799 Transcript_17893/m.45799 type:complete len:202 (+) Transcript_17893:599-1204(+)